MLEKAIRKAVLSILLASLMVGAGCRITYAEEQQQTTESKVATDDTFVQAPSALLMEAGTGTVIYEKDPDTRRSPASITKIMTLILIFDALENGTLKMDDLVTTSAYAKSMGGSQVFLEEGETQDVETMIKCIVIASGNDASVAMAEHIGGSEQEFVRQMNERAAGLGMENTHFVDCCGLTESTDHYTTVRDIAIMSRELITKYPKILEYSSIWMENITHVTRQGSKEFCLTNTNKLLRSYDGCIGLKTGSTSLAKYCVSAVASRNNITLISVVMAAPDYKVRFKDAAAMLNLEDLEGVSIFGFVNPAEMAKLRKALKDDLKYVESFAKQGYIGTVGGINLYTKKDAASGKVVIATKKAVTLFNKKGTEVEQQREENIRRNTIYSRKYYVAAMTDATKAVGIITGTAAATADTAVNKDKSYYAKSGVGYVKMEPAEGDNPKTKGWFEITPA